jgi:hypothetical protein
MTTSRDERPRPRIGDLCVSFTMQPCGPDGHPLHGGNHYANAATLERARDYAYRVLSAPREQGFCCMRAVESVDISGATYEFTGGAWSPRYAKDNYRHHEVITREDVPADWVRPT